MSALPIPITAIDQHVIAMGKTGSVLSQFPDGCVAGKLTLLTTDLMMVSSDMRK